MYHPSQESGIVPGRPHQTFGARAPHPVADVRSSAIASNPDAAGAGTYCHKTCGRAVISANGLILSLGCASAGISNDFGKKRNFPAKRGCNLSSFRSLFSLLSGDVP
jgi:hypothetical protein